MDFPTPRPRRTSIALALALTCLAAFLPPVRLAAQSNQGPKPVGPNAQPDPALNLGATLYAYGTAAGDAAAQKSDDAFTLHSLNTAGPLGSPLSFPFFQTLTNHVYVNNNGLLSINGGVSAWSGQPFPYSTTPIIAPFWADVDTRATDGGTVWYRTAQDAPTLNAISAQIESAFTGTQNFTPRFASIATWDRVGYYASKADYVNTFQAVVASDGVRTYALFLYPNQAIWWLRGISSTADPAMGYDAGNGTVFLNTSDSRTTSMYDVWFSSNTEDNSPGVYAFRLDDGSRETRVVAADFRPSENKLFASYVLRLSDLPAGGTQIHTVTGGTETPVQFDQLVFDDPTETLASTNALLIANAADAVNHGNVVIGGTAQFLAGATGSLNGGTFTLQRSGKLHTWVPNALTARANLTFDNTSVGASGIGGTFDMQGHSTTVGALISLGANAGIITSSLAGHRTLDLAGTDSGNFTGRLENGLGVLSLVKSGSGTQTLSGTNTYTGSTTLSGGTLAVSTDANLGATSAPIVFSGGTLRANASFATARETTLGTGGGTLEIASGANVTWQSGITGDAGRALTKTGSGSLTLSGVNLFYGTTHIQAGTLVVGATGTIPDYSPVVIAEGATLDLANRQDIVGSISGTGQIALGTGTLASGGDNTSTTFGGVISGDGNFTKLGAGSLTLSGPNTLSGATTVSAGTLRAGATGALSSSSTLFLNNGATLDLNGFSQTVADLDSYNTATGLFDPGTVQLGGATLINLTGVQNNWHGTLAGSGNFEKRGSALMVWSGANTFTGVLTVAEGTLATAAADTLSPHASVAVATGATLALQDQAQTIAGLAGAGTVALGSGTLTTGGDNSSTAFAGALTGTGGLTKTGNGTFTLSGTNTYTGNTTVNAGVLVLASGGSINSPSSTISVGNFDHGWLKVDQGAVTAHAVVLGHDGGTGTLTLNGGTLTTSTIERWSGGSTVTFDGGTLRATGDAPLLLNGFTYNSAIINAGGLTIDTDGHAAAFSANTMLNGIGGLTKTGSGTLTLDQPHVYTGATTIAAGTLALGASGSLANSSAFRVDRDASFDVSAVTGGFALASGQTFAGSGSVVGSLAVTSGAILSPGNSPGTLTFTDGLTLNSGAILNFELGAISDLIAVTGGVLTGPASGTVTLNFSNGGGFAAGNYTLINYATASSTSNFGAEDFTFGSTIPGYTYSLSLAGSTLQLTATVASAIPEPSTYAALFGAAVLALALYRRRQQRA